MNGGLNQGTSPRRFALHNEIYVITARTSLPKNSSNPFPKYFRAKSSKRSQSIKSKTPTRQLFSVVTTIITRAMAIAPMINIPKDPLTIQLARVQTIAIRPAKDSRATMGLDRFSKGMDLFIRLVPHEKEITSVVGSPGVGFGTRRAS